MIRNSPEFKAEISADIEIASVDKNIYELTFHNITKNLLYKKAHFDNKFVLGKSNIYFDEYLSYFTKLKTVLNFTHKNKSHNFKLINIKSKDGKIVLTIQGKLQLKQYKFSTNIRLKAITPIVNTSKRLGPVPYTDKNPFVFTSYYALPKQPPTPKGPYTIRNKGAIFWYLPLQVAPNPVLKLNYIMCNTPLSSFVPNSAGFVTLSGADFYYGWFNEFTVVKQEYVDFYIYQSGMNNYLYKFSVKTADFFTKTNFPKTKTIAYKPYGKSA